MVVYLNQSAGHTGVVANNQWRVTKAYFTRMSQHHYNVQSILVGTP
jgi:hypothetical protein